MSPRHPDTGRAKAPSFMQRPAEAATVFSDSCILGALPPSPEPAVAPDAGRQCWTGLLPGVVSNIGRGAGDGSHKGFGRKRQLVVEMRDAAFTSTRQGQLGGRRGSQGAKLRIQPPPQFRLYPGSHPARACGPTEGQDLPMPRVRERVRGQHSENGSRLARPRTESPSRRFTATWSGRGDQMVVQRRREREGGRAHKRTPEVEHDPGPRSEMG
ncbi:hypothetical protein B0T11DRAFT_314553 [Plectosphaerella cucumerina]|uniref:Uncharacterized protein n=1 Tax=Plectosphaerella cucumerina TaxID=40658 RepID=A0A8K0TT70_9PEZI|nr:hypothetical protein B0T11DRAFT_314553 [Plectosphaerella cucumerina]